MNRKKEGGCIVYIIGLHKDCSSVCCSL